MIRPEQSELPFRELIENAAALIWATDSGAGRVYVNHQWSELTGREPASLLGDGWLDCLHPEDRDRVRDLYLDGTLHTGSVVSEFRLRRADGDYRWILDTAVPRPRQGGQFSGMVGCGFDITERRQVEMLLLGSKQRLEQMVAERTRELADANRHLEKRNREQQSLLQRLQETQGQLLQSEKMASIGQLAAGVAHEINTPLGYIRANLSTLKDNVDGLFELIAGFEVLEATVPAESTQRQALASLKERLDLAFLREDMVSLVEESREGADRARKIVQDLKEFSRLEHQRTAPFDLEAGLEATLNILRTELAHKAEVVREYAGLGPIPCVGALINQVLLNLLMNAVQAMEKPGIIRVRTGKQGDDWVWVEVEDTGRGIAEEHLPRLFDPFFTTGPVGRGTGMGLSLAYTVVKQHGGRIEVESHPDTGSRFRVWLPIDRKAPGNNGIRPSHEHD